MTARAKYDAWVSQSRIYPDLDDAKERYVDIARDIGWDGDVSSKGGNGPMGGVKVSTMAPLDEGRLEGQGEGSSKLHDAVIDGDISMARKLISQDGVPVDTRDEYVRPSSHLGLDVHGKGDRADEIGVDITPYSSGPGECRNGQTPPQFGSRPSIKGQST